MRGNTEILPFSLAPFSSNLNLLCTSFIKILLHISHFVVSFNQFNYSQLAMGPSCTRKSSSSSRRRGRRTLFKNSKSHGEKSVSLASSAAKTSSKKMDDISKAGNVVDMSCDNACSTPKAKRHQIPEIQTCPPAPKKRRLVKSSLSSLMRTTSISSSSATGPYFAPPDIELFFYFALRGIPI